MIYDAVIVGAGISGSFIANALVQAGLKCVMLEAGRDFNRQTYPRTEVDANSLLYWGGGIELTKDAKEAQAKVEARIKELQADAKELPAKAKAAVADVQAKVKGFDVKDAQAKVEAQVKELQGELKELQAKLEAQVKELQGDAKELPAKLRAEVAKLQDEVKDLVNEIKFPKDTGGTLILTGAPPPKLPEQPTDGYSTFLGKEKDFEQTLTGKKLRMANKSESGTEVLTIAASPE